MAFKQTEWKMSTKTEQYASVTEGVSDFKIIKATYNDENDKYYDPENPAYKMTLEDVHSGARCYVTYWPEGDEKPARAAVGTLNTLGEALAGVNIGIPFPDDVVGGVVSAEVTFKEGDPKKVRIYRYFAAPESVVVENSEIDQYYKDSADTEVVH